MPRDGEFVILEVILVLSVLKKNYEVDLFVLLYYGLRVTLSDIGIPEIVYIQ